VLLHDNMTKRELLKYRKFECRGDGLMVAGHKRALSDDIKRALPGNTDNKGPRTQKASGKVEKHPKSWWEAQVRLYGLKCDKWTIGNLQAVLEAAVQCGALEVPSELKRLENQLNKIYLHRDNLEEMSSEDSDDDDDSVLTPDDSYVINRFCPTDIGNSTMEQWLERRNKRAENIRNRTLAKTNRDHSLLLLTKNGGGKDPFGTWQIDCPGILNEWPDHENAEQGMTWIIHPPLENDTHSWCSFDQLVIIEGVMGIEWGCKKLERKRWLNVKRSFRFRGLSSGDYDFCCIDEANKGWIKFTSEHECHGQFDCQFAGPWEFTGKKVDLKRFGKRPAALAKEYERLGRGFDTKTAIF